MKTILQEVSDAGVSIWLDDLSRDRLENGSLLDLIAESSVVGVTTNPSIFSAAIANSNRYQEDISAMAQQGATIQEIVTQLTTDDVRTACDLFLPTYLETFGVDGRVSIEVDPRLAHETSATVEQAKTLHAIVNRPNVLIKVPATLEGLPAIEELTAQGISVNVTLIFSVDRYEKVMDAYLRGLERRVANGLSLSEIHSVASFFVSRIDTEIDKRLVENNADLSLKGKAAIANAHLAYESFVKIIASPRWQKLESHRANLQRPLWASTGVKDKSYDSTRYVIELIAPHCVNTMPEATMNEVREHGLVRGNTISDNFMKAREIFKDLENAGIDFADVVRFLEDDGVAKFEKAWMELLDNLANAAQRGKVSE